MLNANKLKNDFLLTSKDWKVRSADVNYIHMSTFLNGDEIGISLTEDKKGLVVMIVEDEAYEIITKEVHKYDESMNKIKVVKKSDYLRSPDK